MNPEYVAEQANRILEDKIIEAALLEMRQEALETLATVDPSEVNAVIYAQAYVAVCDEFSVKLQEFILRLPEKDGPEGSPSF